MNGLMRVCRLIPVFTGALIAGIAGCTPSSSPLDDYQIVVPISPRFSPQPRTGYSAGISDQQIQKGKYLVDLLGCGNCHTQGALLGEPDNQLSLAGSTIGIAYTDPMENRHPGVVYAGNLTPDNRTGLGAWSSDQIVTLLTSGQDRAGHHRLPVMPWTAYSRLSRPDATAIAAYLKSLAPIEHEIPSMVFPGNKAKTAYVHVGFYQRKQP